MSCSSHIEEETLILKSSAFALLLNYFDSSSVFYFSVGQPPCCIAGNPLASTRPQKFTTSAYISRDLGNVIQIYQTIFIVVNIIGAKGMRPFALPVTQTDFLQIWTKMRNRVHELHRRHVVLAHRLRRVQHLQHWGRGEIFGDFVGITRHFI